MAWLVVSGGCSNWDVSGIRGGEEGWERGEKKMGRYGVGSEVWNNGEKTME